MDYSYTTTSDAAGAGVSAVFIILYMLFMFAIIALYVVGLWKTFVKAGEPGWAAIVPFYNMYVMVKISGRPIWFFWAILGCAFFTWIPLLGFLLAIGIWVLTLFIALDIAKNFGQGTGFGVLIWLFGPIMYLVLGFGNYQYNMVANAGGWGGMPAQPMGQPMQPMGQPMQPMGQPMPPAPPAAMPPAPPATAAPAPPPTAPPAAPPADAGPAAPQSPTPPPPPPLT